MNKRKQHQNNRKLFHSILILAVVALVGIYFYFVGRVPAPTGAVKSNSNSCYGAGARLYSDNKIEEAIAEWMKCGSEVDSSDKAGIAEIEYAIGSGYFSVIGLQEIRYSS